MGEARYGSQTRSASHRPVASPPNVSLQELEVAVQAFFTLSNGQKRSSNVLKFRLPAT